MKTIEIISAGHKIQFTTKSVTIGGKELFYKDMSDVTHDNIAHIYSFKYDDKTISIPYEEKYEKILAAIFNQVKALEAKKKAAKSETSQQQIDESSEKPSCEAAPAEENQVETVQEENKTEEAPEESKAEETPEENKAEEAPEENKAEEATEKKAEKEKAPKKSMKERFASFKKNKSEEPSQSGSENSDKAETPKEKEPMDPEKKARLIKSLKVFGIILGIIVVLSVAYYFVFGTSSAPSDNNSNYTESQQYDDIDELINDLQ